MIIDIIGYIFIFLLSFILGSFLTAIFIVYIKKSALEIEQMRLDLQRDKRYFN